MRRLIASSLAVAATVALPAPVHAATQDQGPCFVYSDATAAVVLEAASVVVIGKVAALEPGQSVTVEPEAYLKGATLPEEVTLAYDDALPCEPASFDEGQRILLILGEKEGTLAWPGVSQVFVLDGGNAFAPGSSTPVTTETGLVDAIRVFTGQYSEPAGAADEGARLDWSGTVLPVAAAVLVVFAIALVLMKEWHRIDPS